MENGGTFQPIAVMFDFLLKAFLMRCLGGVLARVTNTSFVVDHLLLMFRGASHSQHTERVGCAQAVGYCATTHTDLVLTELENVAKWEYLKKSVGLFGFIKVCLALIFFINL